MALRITSRGMLSIDYDVESEKWRSTLRPPRLSDLARVIELEPGLSLGMLFDVVAQSPELVEVVGEMCFVDVAALLARSRLDGKELTLSDFRKVISRPDTVVDELVLERRLSLSEGMLADPATPTEPGVEQARDFFPEQWLDYGLAVNGREWRFTSPLGSTFEVREPVPECLQDFGPFVDLLEFDVVFASVVHLPLRLSTEGCIYSERLRRSELPFPWRFYEVLLAAYGPFGKPPYYLDMGQADLIRSEEATDVIRKVFEARDNDPESESDKEES